jgi:hypothetical protein
MGKHEFKARMLGEVKKDLVKKYSRILLNAVDNKPIKGINRFIKELFLVSEKKIRASS